MTERIQQLREQSLNAVYRISAERSLLITEFYKNHIASADSIPVQRAKLFQYELTNKTICINDLELIVGERGPQPKATPTYPEIMVHSLHDLEILNNREEVWFRVDDETRRAYEETIIPFWEGRSNRERIMQTMTPEWHNAYDAGIFTEFMQQRAPGHTAAGYKVYQKGMLDLIAEVDDSLTSLDFVADPKAYDKQEELKAMRIVAESIVMYANRYAEKLDELAVVETEPNRKSELIEMVCICRRVPAYAPATFHEMLQHYWFIHLGVLTEQNPWDSFNPGRLDQHLYPFYKKEIEAGTLTHDKAVEILESFWIKFNNHPSPPKGDVTPQETNAYSDFCLINLGGVKPDGTDAVNEMSYILLDVIDEMRLQQPDSMVQVSRVNPDSFIERAVKIIRTGFGQPFIFNTDAIIQELLNQGKSLVDARNGGCSGCVETGAFGTESYILCGYFNLPKILEVTLHNGFDTRTRKQIGLKTGKVSDFKSYEQLLEAFRIQVNHFIRIKIAGSNTIEDVFRENTPTPFLSLVIEDCVASGTDFVGGGARYNTNYIQGVGLGTMIDSLTALKKQVFEDKAISLPDFARALDCNFDDYDELLYKLLYKTPKYGNDDDAADAQLTDVFNIYYDAVNGHKSPRGADYRINFLPATCHVYFGSVMHAGPDGRRARMPVSDGISPVQGSDKNGPTSVVKSAAKIDHFRTGGTLLNLKFSPNFFQDITAVRKVSGLVRSYFRLNGHHLQFNMADEADLCDARIHPEKYRNLVARAAGYSDNFNDLGLDLPTKIMKKAENKTE